MSERGLSLLVVTLLLVFIGLALAFSRAIPLGKGPDEYVHFLYARFLAEHGRPPNTPTERQTAGYKSDQPPLYHSLVALTTLPVETAPPPAFKFSWEPHSRQLIDIVLSRTLLIRTEDETWPLAGVFLAWMAGRWLSIALGAGTLLFTWLVARQMFPDRPWLALSAAAALAFSPRFIFTSATLNDDNLIGLLLAMFFWRLVLLLKQPAKASAGQFAWLGLLLGLAAVTKYSVLLLPLELVALALWLAQQRLAPTRFVVTRLAAAGGVAAVVVGLWLGFVLWHFNQVDELGPLLGILNPLIAGDASDDTAALVSGLLTGQPDEATERGLTQAEGNPLDWLRQFYQQFFYVPIFGVTPAFPPWLLWATPLLLLALSVLGWRRRWRLNHERDRLWLGLMLLHVGLFLPVPLLRYAFTGQIHDTAQARHLLFPAAPALAILLAAGLAALVPARRQKWIAAVAPLLMLLLALAHLYYFQTGFPPPLPVRTNPVLAAAPPHPLPLTFADGLTLRGFDAADAAGTLVLTLYWQADAVPTADYLTEITLHTVAGEAALHWLSQPAAGRFPARAWDAGDLVRDTLHLPLAGLPPGKYEVALRLLDQTGQPLESSAGDNALLTTLNLSPPATDSVQLWQHGRSPSHAPVFRYRATIPVTAPPGTDITLLDPAGAVREAAAVTGALRLWLVDHTWPSGHYQVQQDGRETGLSFWVENLEWSFELPPLQVEVNANFGDNLLLLGYNLPTRRVTAGDGVPLVLYWQGLRPMSNSYIIFNRLLDADQRAWGGYDRLPKETFPTQYWVPGQVVADGFAVPVDAAAPNGVYNVVIGLYEQDDPTAESIPLVQAGQPTGQTSIRIGPVKVGGPPPQALAGPDAPPQPINANFGDIIRLMGYGISQQAGQLHLKFYWQSLAPTPADYTVFVHLVDDKGQLVAQTDRLPVEGYPTSLWDAGETLAGTVEVSVADLPPGEYTIVAGLYDRLTGVRLLTNNGSDSLILQKITR